MAQGMLPSFFKILLDPSSPYLALPPEFVQKYLKKKKIPDDSILQSVNGGRSWSLKIRKVDEEYSFVDGWNKVVQDTQLVSGDLLVFWLVDDHNSTFKALIFDKNGCQKAFPQKVMGELADEEGEQEEQEVEKEEEKEEEEQDADYDEKEEEEDEGDKNEKDPFFKTTISNCHYYHLRFPSKFARLAGLEKERMIRLKNLDGKEWSLGLLSETAHYKRYYLSSGWSEFRKANQLCEGDECVFEFIRSEDKLSLAKHTKTRAAPSRVEVVKRPRGRPPKKGTNASGKVPAAVVTKSSIWPPPPPPLVEVATKDGEDEVATRSSVGCRSAKRKKGGVGSMRTVT